ncbi:hypothetical protein V12B01_03458 [Vibrio splendidus 12B01]|nr:hypothetical protein V12B01_03458 [Vibrio splendidus 12B01]
MTGDIGLLATPVVANPTTNMLIKMTTTEPLVAFHRGITVVFVVD